MAWRERWSRLDFDLIDTLTFAMVWAGIIHKMTEYKEEAEGNRLLLCLPFRLAFGQRLVVETLTGRGNIFRLVLECVIHAINR